MVANGQGNDNTVADQRSPRHEAGSSGVKPKPTGFRCALVMLGRGFEPVTTRSDLQSGRYSLMVTFERITIDPDVMGGMPTIRGLRIPVATVVAMVADGMTAAEIVDDLPDLVVEDVAEALHYAAEAVRERELPLQRIA